MVDDQAGLGATVPSQNHGTRWCYVRGCRCAACAESNREYMREYMRRRRKTVPVSGGGGAL